jgi:calcineurin-like phosphoesterase family protein
LSAKLKEDFSGKTVVITHHLPSAQSVAERYKPSLTSACFASNLDDLMGMSALWIHGHTHDSMDYVLHGTRILCNPRGYCRLPEAPENRAFDPTLVVEI